MNENNLNENDKQKINEILNNEIPDYNDYKSPGRVYNNYENKDGKNASNTKAVGVIFIFGIIIIGVFIIALLNMDLDFGLGLLNEYDEEIYIPEEDYYVDDYTKYDDYAEYDSYAEYDDYTDYDNYTEYDDYTSNDEYVEEDVYIEDENSEDDDWEKYYNNEYIAEEEFYSEEYDLDQDGYLSYDERDNYINYIASQVAKKCKITEIYHEKEFGEIYFMIENLDNINFISTDFQVAFYDENGKLQEVAETYIENGINGDKVVVSIDYDKPFKSYETVINLDNYTFTEYPTRKANVEIKNEYYNSEYGEFSYDVVNINENTVYGEIYIVFYDKNNNVIYIETAYIPDIDAGKTHREMLYIEPDFTFDRVEYIQSDVMLDAY